MKDFNNFKSNHKYTLECDRYSIDFLDLNVKLNDNDLIINVSVKPAYCHQYLPDRSSHTDHSKQSIVFSQTLGTSRLCSTMLP